MGAQAILALGEKTGSSYVFESRCLYVEQSCVPVKLLLLFGRHRSVTRRGLAHIQFLQKRKSGGRTVSKCLVGKSCRVSHLSSRRSCGSGFGTHQPAGTGAFQNGPGPSLSQPPLPTSSSTSRARPMWKQTSGRRPGGNPDY